MDPGQVNQANWSYKNSRNQGALPSPALPPATREGFEVQVKTEQHLAGGTASSPGATFSFGEASSCHWVVYRAVAMFASPSKAVGKHRAQEMATLFPGRRAVSPLERLHGTMLSTSNGMVVIFAAQSPVLGGHRVWHLQEQQKKGGAGRLLVTCTCRTLPAPVLKSQPCRIIFAPAAGRPENGVGLNPPTWF